ncbi:unnamed protein product [Sphenostylis stenocarpa]|uniref:Uncharacterized protein n=1 Tax=Sphenostylis stenocarpa TaxID=92480 RepID=A0AA86VGL1_9FABA|nr:unnamed protein product [Sphenostylis stenocarpa]
MPCVFSNEYETVMYVENMLKRESGAIGETVSSRILELDVEIGWDGILQEDTAGIFDMELEDIIKFVDEDESCNSMPQSELLNRQKLQDNMVVKKLDSLIVLAFLHLESCQSSGRLAERTVLNAYKSKFTQCPYFVQFVMFYACAPDVVMSAVAYLASYLLSCKVRISCIDHFHHTKQAIMYILCFRMRYLMDIPRLKLQLVNMPMETILETQIESVEGEELFSFIMIMEIRTVLATLCFCIKLYKFIYQVCLPTVVVEFLRQAKASQLFMASESFVFNDELESNLSKAFGGMDRLDMFFPFDPCLLKKTESYIRPHFARWSKVSATYDDDDGINEVSDSGIDVSDDDYVHGNAEDMIDGGDMMVPVEDLDFSPDFNKMSATPKNSLKYGTRMPARIRPSSSPESL